MSSTLSIMESLPRLMCKNELPGGPGSLTRSVYSAAHNKVKNIVRRTNPRGDCARCRGLCKDFLIFWKPRPPNLIPGLAHGQAAEKLCAYSVLVQGAVRSAIWPKMPTGSSTLTRETSPPLG